MWLLNSSTLKLEHFFGSNIPEYAILSHTWEEEEVSFQEMALPSVAVKKGYSKIKNTCARALRHGIPYAWVDTCCIDKSSSAELTESINSMFQWYQNAALCYVFLSDLPPDVSAEDGLKTCRWFTRGWTLQELIAPRHIRFYDQRWGFVGLGKDLAKTISSITNIDRDVLLGRITLNSYSVATRMSWAAHRQTTREEDMAYCLLGMFDVGMSLIYGEGTRAFRRLQEQIMENANDLTIFAWDHGKDETNLTGPFAPSPSAFSQSNDIRPWTRQYIDPEFTLTNKGLRFDKCTFFYKNVTKYHSGPHKLPIDTSAIAMGYQVSGDEMYDVSMVLRKVGPDRFIRYGKILRQKYQSEAGPTATTIQKLYIAVNTIDMELDYLSEINFSIHFPKHDMVQIHKVIPESHWDGSRRLFFSPLQDMSLVLAMLCEITLPTTVVQVVILILTIDTTLEVAIFNAQEHTNYSQWLFHHRRNGYDVTLDDVHAEMLGMLSMTSQTEIWVDGVVCTLSVSLEHEVIKPISNTIIQTLNLSAVDSFGGIIPIR